MTYIMMALGWILELFYRIIGNYGFAIILFTVFIKACLLPLDLKQRRSMAKTQKIQPLLNELQKKYGNDKEKLNQEMMKLYQKYGINPMGGCLPMLIQLPIIFALYWVVKKPITYIMGVDAADVWRIAEAFNAWAAANPDALPETIRSIVPLTYQSKMSQNTFGNYEIQIAQVIYNNPEILNHQYITSWGENLKFIDFTFLGMNLAEVPNFGALLGLITGNTENITLGTVLLWFIPILSGVSAFVSSRISMASQPKKSDEILPESEKPKEGSGAMGESMKSMTTIMPLFSVWFAFTLPGAVGLYWIISNVIQMIQQVTVSKYMEKVISTEEIEGEIENVRKGRKNRKKSR